MILVNSLKNKRIDCILIWGHGMAYFDDIVALVRNESDFDLLKIVKHRPKNIKKFVREVYSFDYAPFWHLKAKTRYLLKTEKEVCFLFIENRSEEWDFLGEGSFRHKESLALKSFKDRLRDYFNPRENGKKTEHHVIHATDSEEQAHYLLKYLGHEEGIGVFSKENRVFGLPYYLKGYTRFIIKEVGTDELYCTVVVGKSWSDYRTEQRLLSESPQYLGLTRDIMIYKEYVSRFIGGPLQEDYNLDRYLKLSSNFEYLSSPFETYYVLVETVAGQYVIVDGMHRASIHLSQGKQRIKVCQISIE